MGRQRRMGSPEGTRARCSIRRSIRSGPIVVVVALFAAFAIAIGGETPGLTVKNETAHILTLAVDDQVLPNLDPGKESSYHTAGPTTVHVKVAYAPGQDVEGYAERSFAVAFAGSTQTGSVFFGCSFNGGVTQPIPHPVMWNVTADTLAEAPASLR